MAEPVVNGEHGLDIAAIRKNVLSNSTKRRATELHAVKEQLANGRYASLYNGDHIQDLSDVSQVFRYLISPFFSTFFSIHTPCSSMRRPDKPRKNAWPQLHPRRMPPTPYRPSSMIFTESPPSRPLRPLTPSFWFDGAPSYCSTAH